jgi:hypothetical protein
MIWFVLAVAAAVVGFTCVCVLIVLVLCWPAAEADRQEEQHDQERELHARDCRVAVEAVPDRVRDGYRRPLERVR